MEEQSVYKNLLKLGVEQNPKIQASLQKMQTANSKMDTYIQLRKMAEGIKGNILKMSDVPAKYRTFVSDILLREGYDPAKIEEEKEIKKSNKAKAELLKEAERALRTLQKIRGNVTGFAPGFLRQFREKIGAVTPESVTARGAIADVSKQYFKVAGTQFTATEREILEPLIPEAGEDEGVIIGKLQQLINSLSEDVGKEPERELLEIKPQGRGFLDKFTPKLGEERGDLGSEYAQILVNKGYIKPEDAEEHAKFANAFGEGAMQMTLVSREDMNNLFKSIKNLFKKVKGAPNVLKLAEKSTAARNELIDDAVKNKKYVNANKLASATKEWGKRMKRAFPKNKTTIDKWVSGANKTFKGKKLRADTALKLWEDSNSGYTSAKNKGKGISASYHRLVRDVLRKELDVVVPGFDTLTKSISKGIGTADLFKQIGRAGVLGGAGTAGGLGVYKLFGSKGKAAY